MNQTDLDSEAGRVLLERTLPSKLEAIADLAADLDRVLPGRPDLAFAANLCLEELIANTIHHGLNGAPDHEIRVRVRLLADWLEIQLQDDAPPYDPFVQAPPPDLEARLEQRMVGGLGVHLVRTMMDRVKVWHNGAGNLTVLLKRTTPPEAPAQPG